jgi:hypothetical protein
MAGGGLGAWGESQLQNAVSGFFGNPYLRDYTHASKTFLPNAFQNAPKLKFLFHTVFELNPDVANFDNTNINLSVLVKSVKLPGFTMTTQQLNQYNRKRINQTKIQYDPVDITFHDDSGNVISSLWYRYYTYYYRDGLNPQVVLNGKRGANTNTQNVGGGVSAPDSEYTTRTQYVPSTTNFQNWGYNSQGVQTSNDPNKKAPFFNNITVFGINRHQWISYTLINPVITRFGHDTYDYEQGNGVMSNSMTLDYETVVYNQGALAGGDQAGNILKGFGDNSVYDLTTSPIMQPGANQTVLGQGGLISAAGGFIKDLQPNGGGILAAIRTAGVTYNTVKNINPTSFIESSITQAFNQSLNSTNNPTRNTSWEIPTYGATGQQVGTAGAPNTYQDVAKSISDNIPQSIKNIFGSGQTAGTQVPDPSQNYYP